MTDDERHERFVAIYRQYHTQILAYALRRMAADGAQDVVAETFVAAWQALPTLPADPAPWLYRAAWYRIATERRSASRRSRLAARVAAQGAVVVSDHAAGAVDAVRVRDGLRRLSEKDREAILLTCWEDLSCADAAFVLGCSVTALKVRLMRARRRLARMLQPETGRRADGPAPLDPPTTFDRRRTSARPESLGVER